MCIFCSNFFFFENLYFFFVAKISKIILFLRCPPFNNTFFDPMFRIFLAALIISSLFEIEYPVNTSASGILGVTKLHKGFKIIASTKESKLTIIENTKSKIYGVQFHPEVTHTENGKEIFKNFLFSICKIKKKWRVASETTRLINDIKKTVKKDKVICALSGGVDSSVVALLVNKAIKKNLICIMVDTGLMRKNEFKDSYNIFKKQYRLNVKLVDASKLYLKKLILGLAFL